MENIIEVRCDLREPGIGSCDAVWKWTTGAWCGVKEIEGEWRSIDCYYGAAGICIVTNGKFRRIVREGGIFCVMPDKRRTTTVMMGGNSTLYGIRMRAPSQNSSWCGMDMESSMRGWRMLEDMARTRQAMAATHLAAGWEELIRRGEKAKTGGPAADASMALGSLVARILFGICEAQQHASGTKSAERILAFLESCNVRCMPNVGSVARRLGYSTGHLMACARATFGITLKQCMDMIRCEHAIRLVKTRKTVQEAAKACGFESWVTFRMTFARQFGKSVNDVRREYGITIAKKDRQIRKRWKHHAIVQTFGR